MINYHVLGLEVPDYPKQSGIQRYGPWSLYMHRGMRHALIIFWNHLLWCPIKMRVFHQNESCLSCLHLPSSYEGRREQGRQLSF